MDEKYDFDTTVSIVRDLGNILVDKINGDERIKDAYHALDVISNAASLISSQYSGGKFHFALVPAEISATANKMAIHEMIKQDEAASHNADSAEGAG